MYIQILTSAVFLTTTLYGGGPVDPVENQKREQLAKKVDFFKSVQIEKPVKGPDTLENYVKKYFSETPILAEIARCESGYRHFEKGGQIIKGKVNPDDVGIMQINEYYHGKPAKALGHDFYTLEGNLEYAKWLYEEFGTSPWNASKPCWGNDSKLAIAK